MRRYLGNVSSWDHFILGGIEFSLITTCGLVHPPGLLLLSLARMRETFVFAGSNDVYWEGKFSQYYVVEALDGVASQ